MAQQNKPRPIDAKAFGAKYDAQRYFYSNATGVYILFLDGKITVLNLEKSQTPHKS